MQSALLRRKIAAAAANAPPVERVWAALPAALADLFGAEWAPRDITARAIAAPDAAGALIGATCFAFDSDAGAGLVAFDNRAVIATADKALGRLPDQGEPQSTHVDRMLASGAAQKLLTLVFEAQGQRDESLRMLTIGEGADATKLMKGSLFAYAFRLAPTDGTQSISISILAPAIAAAQAHGDGKTMRAFGETAARAASVSLRVEIGVVVADIGAAMTLATGDLLKVEMLGAARLKGNDGANTIASGKVGGADGARALRIRAAADR